MEYVLFFRRLSWLHPPSAPNLPKHLPYHYVCALRAGGGGGGSKKGKRKIVMPFEYEPFTEGLTLYKKVSDFSVPKLSLAENNLIIPGQ
jgi:hypothetical protein